MECTGGCQTNRGLFFRVVCHGPYSNLPHKIHVQNGITSKLFNDICQEPKHFARIAYNNEPGQFEVNNSKLVDTGYNQERKSYSWEVLQQDLTRFYVEL